MPTASGSTGPPCPARAGQAQPAQYEPPQGATEQILAQIFAQVLGVERVGREDNFFELGGDSILSIQIKARAAERGADFALEDLFELQTIARLGAAISGGRIGELTPFTPTAAFALLEAPLRARLDDGTLEDAYPLSSMQLAMIFHSQLDRLQRHLPRCDRLSDRPAP